MLSTTTPLPPPTTTTTTTTTTTATTTATQQLTTAPPPTTTATATTTPTQALEGLHPLASVRAAIALQPLRIRFIWAPFDEFAAAVGGGSVVAVGVSRC